MRPPRILVVDDTEEVRTLVCRILESEGYEVLEAVDGISALQACQDLHGELHLLLTDINMPGMGGVELAARLRLQYPEVYVLYFSGESEGVQLQAQMANQRCGFLPKPFLPLTLIQIVEQALATGKRPGQAALSAVAGVQAKRTA